MCNSIIRVLNTLQWAHHQKSSFHPSPYKPSPLYPFCPPHLPSSLVTTNLFSVSMCWFIFSKTFILDVRAKSCSSCLPLSDLPHFPSYPQGPSMLLQMARFHLFYSRVIFCCYVYMYIHTFILINTHLHPSIHQWAIRLLTYLGYHK